VNTQNQPIELLTTKFSIPASRPTLIPRDGLLAKLNNGLRRGCRLILVSAPAGAGKTTLLSAWLRQLAALDGATQDRASFGSAPDLAWLTLDRADNQPARFWSYLIGALQTIDVGLGREAQRLLAAPHHRPIHTVLCALLNDLAAYARPIILVLDAFEAITASAIHRGLVFIVDHTPAQLHLVLSSRVDPPLPLARFRAHDQLAELRGNELGFTVDETAAFLSSLTGVPWRAQDAWALHARTEGWVAGLQIAGLELQKLLADVPRDRIGHESARFADDFSGHHQDIRDFLQEEVLHRQPQDVQVFLMLTSVLKWLNSSLCDAITRQTGSQELLEQLVRANLVVGPAPGAPPWYRYQRMFREVLQARLCQTQPDLIPLLHQRAAEWYEAHRDSAVPMLGNSDVIVVDAPTDEAHRLVCELATARPGCEHATLVPPMPQEHAPQTDPGATSLLLDQGHMLMPLVEQLTQRELEVLQLLAEGLSYMDIGRRLVVSLNTVRFHVKNIYDKLDVHQRTQAIARAKTLHILPS
jgi:LuxR family maltose regulon positive regulatory protein